MALFEDFSTNDEDDDETLQHYFPTHPPFLCPVEIKDTDPDVYGEGHKGVFSVEKIPKDTEIWVWTERIIKIHHTELNAYIEKNFNGRNKMHDIQLFLRQGFVFPPLLPSSFGENTDTMTTEKDTKTTTTITTTTTTTNHLHRGFSPVNSSIRTVAGSSSVSSIEHHHRHQSIVGTVRYGMVC
mmetsp:Transcript_43655/g.50312  ORF Transcript_43655/g.50312 Transcript_43655/m.50312 type:complete len:183 (+) Transcript_43655:15-563(+)